MKNQSLPADEFEPINGTQSENCPHIGLFGDPATFSDFPAQMNACHHVNPINTPNLYHQRSFCLSPTFVDCPIFQNALVTRMPKDFQYQSLGLSNQRKRRILYIVLGVIGLALVFSFLINAKWRPSSSAPIPPEETQFSPTLIQTAIQPTPEEDELNLPQTTPTPTELILTVTQASPTPTSEPQNLALDSPIGKEYQFIIHRVAEGETLQIFADQYNTSVEAITAVNYELISPLWIGWLVIIPLNTTEVSNLPAFEAYMIQQQSIDLRELADQLSASLEKIALYNNLNVEYLLTEGEWLLIPRERPES
jgi:hypothetical protein